MRMRMKLGGLGAMLFGNSGDAVTRPMSRIQPSLRDSALSITLPGVETPGYFREVPPGLQGAAETRNFRKALILCGSLAVLDLIAAGCNKSNQSMTPPPPAVTATQPAQREVIEWNEYPGRLD